jgi:amino acid transporter
MVRPCSAKNVSMAVKTSPLRTPESIGYAFKRLVLGKPMITEQLKSERLSNPVALGVLSPDAISSSAYGTEEILIELLPYAGLAAFALLLPITGVILFILILVAASYREVVMAYTRAGGSYVVARENFGPRVAQIAAAALLIDYIVTVAAQAAAGTVAVVSAIRPLGPYSLEITVAVVVLMCLANLRGLREAGRPFAVPTYIFIVVMTLMIVAGVIREIFWGLPHYDPQHVAGLVDIHQDNGLVMGASILVLLRAFANGGSSLTGVEAISNTVSVFRKPQGPNARKVLTAMACILGFLVAGVSYLAYATHSAPYAAGYPSVLSEVARAVFGNGFAGHILYVVVQVATAAILFTGANTSFNGFPALANFVAGDRFLPRQLAKRGHRLVFSNGIVVLTVLSVALLVATGGSVNALVPFYAIGVFTGFAMAGYGMTKHHLTHRERGWRHKLAINVSAGVISTVVVGIFAVAKFTEGAWLVVVVFPLMVFVLIRLNREYRAEAAILEKFRTDRPDRVRYARHRVFALVNGLDLAVLEALRYGRGLRADELTAVHFVVDTRLRSDNRAVRCAVPDPGGVPGPVRGAANPRGGEDSGIAVDGLISGHRATVEGRVRQVDEKISHGKPIRVVTIGDASGELRVKFGPGHGGTEIQPGQLLRLTPPIDRPARSAGRSGGCRRCLCGRRSRRRGLGGRRLRRGGHLGRRGGPRRR